MITETVGQLYVHLKIYSLGCLLMFSLKHLLDPMTHASKSLIEFGSNLASFTSSGQVSVYFDYLPTTTATTYLRGQMYFNFKDYARASEYFSKTATAFLQIDPNLSSQVDLQYVLPSSVLEKASASVYYHHIAELFGRVRKFDAVNRFCYLANSAADEEAEASSQDVTEFKQTTWFRIFHSALDNGAYEEAYMAMIANPDAHMRRDCLRHLVGVLCEGKAGMALLCRLGFPGLQEEVEANLLFKARNSDLFAHPNYYQTLHVSCVSW